MELLLRSKKWVFCNSIPETLPAPFQPKLPFHNIKRLETVATIVLRRPWNLGNGAPAMRPNFNKVVYYQKVNEVLLCKSGPKSGP